MAMLPWHSAVPSLALPLILPPTLPLLAILEVAPPNHSHTTTQILPSCLASHVIAAPETRRGHDAGLPCTRNSNGQQLLQLLLLLQLLQLLLLLLLPQFLLLLPGPRLS